MELWELDVVSARESLAAGRASSVEVMQACLDRIDLCEPEVGAWTYLDRELALGAARSADVSRPLGGVPCGVKDIFNTIDMPTGMGSPVWTDFTPGNDARVVFNAKRAGCAVVGKTVTAEFAVHAPGKTRNPYDPTLSPGTSSSGSAAAVACGMVPWSLGSQTAGSIIRPASYCGVYGFKPSYGLIPRTGMLKTTDTLDQIGFFSRSPGDLWPLLENLRVHGRDYPLIAKSLDRTDTGPVPSAAPTVGFVGDALWTWGVASDEVRASVQGLARELAEAGCEVREFSKIPILTEAHAVHGMIYDRCIAYYFDRESREGTLVSREILEMVERGREITLSTYTKALDAQVQIQRAFAAAMANFDVLLMPSTSGPAPRIGERDADDASLIWSLCGVPSISVPLFTSTIGLPFGAQFVAAKRHDHDLLGFLARLERDGIAPRVTPVTPGLPKNEIAEPLRGSTEGRVLT